MRTVTAPCVHVPCSVELHTVGDPSVSVCEDAPVQEDLCVWVDIVFVTIEYNSISWHLPDRKNSPHIVAGSVRSFPSRPTLAPVSVLHAMVRNCPIPKQSGVTQRLPSRLA